MSTGKPLKVAVGTQVRTEFVEFWPWPGTEPFPGRNSVGIKVTIDGTVVAMHANHTTAPTTVLLTVQGPGGMTRDVDLNYVTRTLP